MAYAYRLKCSPSAHIKNNLKSSIFLVIYLYTVVNCQRNVYKWQFANDINLCDYELNTHKLANDIIVPYDALCCRITNCTLHNSDIDCFYNAIISVLHKSDEKCIPTSVLKSGNYTTIPGLNDYVKEHHNVAKDALSLWRFNNKPKFDPVIIVCM